MNVPAPSRHMAARVVWDTAFDASAEVRPQQDWLSDFSRRVLPDLLQEVFESCCPADQLWRCDRLEVNVGSIALAEAGDELPRRLKAALREALLRRFGPTARFRDVAEPGADGPRAVLEHLLLHGVAPWWAPGDVASLADLWESLRVSSPKGLASLLRRLGRHEAVRRRLVWQLGPARMPGVVALLQPLHADALAAWVGDLTACRHRETLVPDHPDDFEVSAWLALLTCLMVERGSTFNTVEFARDHLRRLALDHGVAHQDLLDRLSRIIRRPDGRLPRRFVALVEAVLKRDRSGDGSVSVGIEPIAGLDAAALRRKATETGGDEAFRLALISLCLDVAARYRWPRGAAWAAVPFRPPEAGLSRGERRRWVEHAVRRLGQGRGFGPAELLDAMIAAARDAGPDPWTRLLLEVALDMRKAAIPVERAPAPAGRDRRSPPTSADAEAEFMPFADENLRSAAFATVWPELLAQVPAWLRRVRAWNGAEGRLRTLLQPAARQLTLGSRARHMALEDVLGHCLLEWCRVLRVSAAECATLWEASAPAPAWREACRRVAGWMGGEPLPVPGGGGRTLDPDAWGAWLHRPEAERILLHLLCRGGSDAPDRRRGVAGWPGGGGPAQRVAAAVHRLAWLRPQALRRLLRRPWQCAGLRSRLEGRLRAALPLSSLVDLIGRHPTHGADWLAMLGAWRRRQERLPFPHAARREEWLWRTLWRAWLLEDWRLLEPNRLTAEFRRSFPPLSGMDAAALCPSAAEDGAAPRRPAAAAAPSPPTPPDPAPPASGLRLPVTNAGLVLLNSFLLMLFTRLDLTRDGRRPVGAAAWRAVLGLQFLACGRSRAEEPHLVLNKVLCGLPIPQPVPPAVELSPDETAVLDGLLEAVRGHWRDAGAGNDSLRGNWLLRAGVLAEDKDHFSLTVERKPWDILLARCPFSYSVVKLPWMSKALYVTWPN